MRLHDAQLSALDRWREQQGNEVSRPEAIRRLVELALKSKSGR